MTTPLHDLIQEDFGIEGRGKWMHSQEHDSLVYNSEEDYFFWNAQNIKGKAIDYLVKVRGMEKTEARNFLNNYFGAFKENGESDSSVGYSKPYEKLVDIMWANGINNREYWHKRCLTDETIDRYRLGYYNGWNLIPIYEDGEFFNFQMRRDEPKKSITQWYRTGQTLPLFNESVLPYVERIFITEGTVDAILLNQVGIPAVSPNGTNTWQASWFDKFNKIKEIVYVEDHDKAGRNGARLVANSLGTGRVRIVSFTDYPDKYDTVNFFQDGGTKESYLDWVENNSHYLFELEIVYGIKRNIGKPRKVYQYV